MITLIHGDALSVTADMFAACDVLIVDPPYSDHVHANATSVGAHDGRAVHARALGFDALTPELRAHIALAARRVRRWSAIFSDFEGAHDWRAACAPAEYIRLVPWVRWSQPQLSGDRPCTGAEAVSIFHATGARGKPIKKRWNGPGSLTHFARRCLRGADKHPTEKPLDLMLDMVAYFSDPGETVIDLCAGAGTTALACRLLGRDCVAVERDEHWAARAKMRVRATLSDRDLARAQEWCVDVDAEARRVPPPTGDHDVRTWERAQRRIADVARVVGVIS